MIVGPLPSWPPPERRIVLTLLCDGANAPLSPFYALARWIGVADFRGRLHSLIRSPGPDADEMTASIVRCQPRVLISGFVPNGACAELIAAGIDVRLGPCSEAATALASRFESLPRADAAQAWPDLTAHSLGRG
jgi:hypothetical protein